MNEGPDDKTREYLEAIKLNPKNDRAYNDLGNAYYSSGEYEKAIEQYQKAKELKPDEAIYYSNIGDANRALGNWDEAINHYNEALRKNERDDWSLNSLGIIYYMKREYDRSIEYYNEAIGINPSQIYYTNIGDSYRMKGDTDSAIPYYEEAIGLNADHDPAYNALGVAYYTKGEFDKAREYYQKAIQLKPSAVYYSNLGDVHRALEKWDEAIKNYNEAVKLDERDDLSYNGLGNAYFGKRLYSKAIEQYEKAKSFNSNPIYFSNIGDANRKLKKWDKAIEYYQKAIERAKEIDPNDTTYHKSLGLAYNDRGVEFYNKKEDDKAIQDYKEAIKFNSEDAVIHHNLYLVCDAKNMNKEAEKSLRKAIELDPSNPIYAQELKELLSKMH